MDEALYHSVWIGPHFKRSAWRLGEDSIVEVGSKGGKQSVQTNAIWLHSLIWSGGVLPNKRLWIDTKWYHPGCDGQGREEKSESFGDSISVPEFQMDGSQELRSWQLDG